MDIAGYTESSSEGEHENDFSLLGNMSRHASYPSPGTESLSNGSNHSANSLVRELRFVKGRLEEERDKLKEWEGRLRGREEKLLCLERTAWEAHKNLSSIATSEVAKRWRELEENQDRVLSELRGDLREKGQENNRLKNSFNYVRQGNDVLRQQVTDLRVFIISFVIRSMYVIYFLLSPNRARMISSREKSVLYKDESRV